MRPDTRRHRSSNRAAWAAAGVLLAAAAASVPSARIDAAGEPERRADHLLVLSSTDLKGKTSPCGCHTPKGGFSRRAAFTDSLRREYSQVVIVDGGGWFPEGTDEYREVAGFMADELGRSGEAGVGIGARELQYGLGFLRAVVAHGATPAVCANLVDRAGKPVFPPYRIVQAGRLRVGVFGLIAQHADLGPSRDSLQALDPIATAHRVVGEMRARGATVVVLVASLGKVDGEELVTAIEGIDALVPSVNIPLMQLGRTVNQTVVTYGGEQGHYIGVTDLVIGTGDRVASGECQTYVLGPTVPENAEVQARVKAFEDAFNDHERAREQARTAEAADAAGEPVEYAHHYVGAEVCGRCHAKEYAQWRTTAHSRAWQTLVDQRKDATPECVVCHVAGYRKPGGFETGADAARLGNVQCENCHGMGTEHDSWPILHAKVPESTCRGCHTDVTSPVFAFDVFRPHILHEVPAVMPPLPPRPKAAGMLGSR